MTSTADKMKPFRARIDALDEQIVELLAQRTDIIREVADFKFENDIPAVLEDRIEEVRERAAALAVTKNMDPETVRLMYRILISYSCNLEDELMQEREDSARSGKVVGA